MTKHSLQTGDLPSVSIRRPVLIVVLNLSFHAVINAWLFEFHLPPVFFTSFLHYR